MKMEKLSYLLVLISLWFLLELTHSEKEISLLPTNMKIHLYPGLINITWDCNITESMKDYKYDITFQDATDKTITISDCFYDYCIPKHMDFEIHHGLHIEVFVKNKSSDTSDTIDITDTIIEKKSLTAMPEGKENTAAENFACVIYNVSIVNFSWTAGREAPKDTNYSLAIRNGDTFVPCEDYRHDSFGRQVGCVLKPPPNIDFNNQNYIQLVGSSEETSIRFYDARLKLNNYVILDPPRNISLNYSMNNLEITWEKPETYNSRGACFKYSIKINEGDDIEIVGGQNSYKAAILLDNENLSVSMRVKWMESCSDNKNWSRWSEPIIYYSSAGSTSLAPHYILITTGIVTAAVLFILVFLCHRYRIWKKLFPKVPQPAMKYFDQGVQKEFWDQNILDPPPKKYDDEECICTSITEISKKDQLEIIT